MLEHQTLPPCRLCYCGFLNLEPLFVGLYAPSQSTVRETEANVPEYMKIRIACSGSIVFYSQGVAHK